MASIESCRLLKGETVISEHILFSLDSTEPDPRTKTFGTRGSVLQLTGTFFIEGARTKLTEGDTLTVKRERNPDLTITITSTQDSTNAQKCRFWAMPPTD